MMDFEPEFYKKLVAALNSNAVLMKVDKYRKYEPIWCSEEFLEMVGGTEEEYILSEQGSNMNSIHPDDQEAVTYLFQNKRTREGLNHLDIRKRTMQGDWKWVKIRYAFLTDNDTEYAYCVYEDITEVKESQAQTQAMYEELNKELNAIADNSLSALRLNLTKGVVEEVRGTDLYDVDRAGANISELFEVRMANMPLEADRERYLKTFDLEGLKEKYYLGEGPTSLVFFSRRESGRQCFIKYSASMRKDPITGDVIVLGVESEYNSEKVTEVLNEKVLAKQYDMVCYIVDSSYGVVIGDAKNTKKGSIFPKKRDGVYSEYIQNEVIPYLEESLDKAELAEALSMERIKRELAKKEDYTVDVPCRIDGEVFYKRFTFYEVDPEAEFYILLKSDITDVLREQREQNELLVGALDEAERANVAKTAFLSSMSHEIRTPMNAIIGLDTIALQDPELPESTKEHLEKIGSSARHLLGLINDILDMSRIESGRMTIRKEEFDFQDMLDQINTMIGGQCRDKGLIYENRIIGKTDDYYIGDDMKLKQVIINILGNAVKFTPEGGKVSFLVEQTAVFEGKASLRFIMRDTGIGMDKEYLPKIFDAFSQEDSRKANKYGSTGLGMAITKNIVEMMNGNINVESEKGVGSTFTVNVTLKTSTEKHAEEEEIQAGGLRVLVVDDDPIDCEHAKIALGEIGITPDICMSGKEAVEHIEVRIGRHEPYDLILVDWKMPEQDGVMVTKEIRKISGSESAVIVLTSHSWDDIEQEATEAGVDHFMAKPLFSGNVLSAYKQARNKKDNAAEKKKKAVELAGCRVLLAEDMAINAEIMKMLLSTRQIEADHAENGQIAIDMFRESKEGFYDAILMDVRMPVLDGLGATKAIRALEREDARTVPIIAMTANAFDEDVQRSLQAGMNAHLSKPVEQDKLFSTLEELIRD
ncbi:MAG: response regulator [Lachnospiraceae bacterium]|nr:response regulator [Lachnospiraceae bacterium]